MLIKGIIGSLFSIIGVVSIMSSGDIDPGSPSQKKSKLSSSEDEEEEQFPKTLEGFGYTFKKERLRKISTGTPFEFEVKPNDHDYNQRHYEALGEVITEYVYDLLIQESGLKKKVIPIDASNSEPTTFIFHSDDAFTNKKLIILIHGSGVVRAGQWARRLIINDCLNSGTQIPFINRAKGLGYGLIVLNTNDNKRVVQGSIKRIRGSESPESHASYVWQNLVVPSAAKHIAIIAHSYGGVVTGNLCSSFPASCQEKIFAIALTDSPHNPTSCGMSTTLVRWFKKVGRNWICSNKPLGTALQRGKEVPPFKEDMECVSAGTTQHEMSSWSSFAVIFEFIDHKYRVAVTAEEQSAGRREL